jgi:putative IMPACT (imprinted ancient) family translation regulator
VRYFGGTKLGVSGLINAYKTTAQLTLEASTIVTELITENIKISFDYANINKVMRIVKEKNLNIVHQKLELDCEFIISVRLQEIPAVLETFDSLLGIKTVVLND